MAVLRLNATRDGALLAHTQTVPWSDVLDRALDRVPHAGRVTVLVHGYRFTWRHEGQRAAPPHCPQARLYCTAPTIPRQALWPGQANWPAALGLEENQGLVIGFGWEGRRPTLSTLLANGRNDFAVVYDAAALAGAALGRLLGWIAAQRPDLRPDFLAHSLGARVVLSGMRDVPALPFGRAVLLGAAEYAGVAQATLKTQARCGGGGEVFHAFSRANDLFDALFGLLAPRPTQAGDRSLGHRGMVNNSPAATGRWVDLQLDAEATARYFAVRGIRLERGREVVSHWHFYNDPGAMAAWRAILERRPGWSPAQLRHAGLGDRSEPRWSRLLPRIPRS
ncbi:MAG: hypothetical protein AAF675_03160, partial [Pseudomonadota bacterium]